MPMDVGLIGRAVRLVKTISRFSPADKERLPKLRRPPAQCGARWSSQVRAAPAWLLWRDWRFCKDSPSRKDQIALQAVLLRKFLR